MPAAEIEKKAIPPLGSDVMTKKGCHGRRNRRKLPMKIFYVAFCCFSNNG